MIVFSRYPEINPLLIDGNALVPQIETNKGLLIAHVLGPGGPRTSKNDMS